MTTLEAHTHHLSVICVYFRSDRENMRYSKLMKLRTVGFCLALALGSSGAFASFELVMVGDSATKSIHRFDGSTGAYLGSFGSGHFEPQLGFSPDTTLAAGASTTTPGLRQALSWDSKSEARTPSRWQAPGTNRASLLEPHLAVRPQQWQAYSS
jgi:hypothetical protein